MVAIKGLLSRVDAEFWALGEKHRKAQAEQVQAYQERQKRPQQLGQVFDRLRDVWGPRLEVLVKKFGDRVQVTPRVAPSTREAKFQFESKLARIDLRLSASPDGDVTKSSSVTTWRSSRSCCATTPIRRSSYRSRPSTRRRSPVGSMTASCPSSRPTGRSTTTRPT
jgi:hypothetical protein